MPLKTILRQGPTGAASKGKMTGGVARGPDRRFPVGRTAPASRVHFPSQRNLILEV
jgi:hypothetical protein